MNAEYTTSLLYPGNPYVEALPPMLAGQELIRALAFLKNLGMVSDYMAELATVRVPRPQRETEHSPAAICSPEATAPHDLRGTLRAAKKSGRPPLDAYSEYIKGEVEL